MDDFTFTGNPAAQRSGPRQGGAFARDKGMGSKIAKSAFGSGSLRALEH